MTILLAWRNNLPALRDNSFSPKQASTDFPQYRRRYSNMAVPARLQCRRRHRASVLSVVPKYGIFSEITVAPALRNFSTELGTTSRTPGSTVDCMRSPGARDFP